MTLVESIVIEMAEADGQAETPTYLDDSLQKSIFKKAAQLGMKYALPVGQDANALANELFQIGCEAAMKYSSSYDPNYITDAGETVKPITYLMKCAWGAMQKRCNEIFSDNQTLVSMDAPTGGDDEGEEDSGTLHDVVADKNSPDPAAELDRKESTNALMNALRQLPKQQRYIITSIYGIGCEEKNQTILGKELGMSHQRIWHEIDRAKKTLRKLLHGFEP